MPETKDGGWKLDDSSLVPYQEDEEVIKAVERERIKRLQEGESEDAEI